ncbi:MAG: PAS domain S-box protein [gamma proteobacterium symbiont of Phacoides pectinatus]
MTAIYSNNRLVFSGREEFPAHYRTRPLDEIFAMQRSQGAAHYDNLLAGVQRGNTSSDWVIWSGKTGRKFTFWSSATINGDIWTFGLSVPEASILSSPLLRQELQRANDTAIAGSLLTLTLLGVLLFSEISSHRHIVDLRREISDRTAVETDLGKSENRYRRLFSHSKAMQLIIESKTGRIIDANAAAARFYGYPIEFMQAMSLSDLNAMPVEQLKEQITSAKSAERDHYLFQHRLSNGELRDVEMYTTGVRLHGNNLLYAIIHDITERIRMEEEIKHLGNHDVLTGRKRPIINTCFSPRA